jgi:hypothetical protein
MTRVRVILRGVPDPRPLEESVEHTPTNEPIEGVVSIEGYTKSAATGFKESLLLSVNPEAEFVDPDEDLDSVFARRGGAFEEAQSWRPVIVRIHPDAGRETVLRLLDKIRAKVELEWEVIVPAHDPET